MACVRRYRIWVPSGEDEWGIQLGVRGWEAGPWSGSLSAGRRPESVTPVLCMALVEFTVNSLGQ